MLSPKPNLIKRARLDFNLQNRSVSYIERERERESSLLEPTNDRRAFRKTARSQQGLLEEPFKNLTIRLIICFANLLFGELRTSRLSVFLFLGGRVIR